MNFTKLRQKLFKHSIREFIAKFKQLPGSPHYIAMGMAIGFFVSLTPTIPFHTFIAIPLAFILGGSKKASAIGVWFCNPATVPFLYVASYKVGSVVLGNSSPFEAKSHSVSEIFKSGWDVFYAMLAGGVLLGLISGIAAYIITYKIITTLRSQKKQSLLQ